jgi:hypothetical protein
MRPIAYEVKHRGFIKIVLLIVLAWGILAYFHIDIRALVAEYLPWLQQTAEGIWYLVQSTWAVIISH